MTNYQKAIKVRKVCETKSKCEDCEYNNNCENVTKKGEIKMTDKEKKFLDDIDEKVYHCLQRGIDKKYIAEQLDDVIYNLPEETSSELFNILYRIQDNLLFGNEF